MFVRKNCKIKDKLIGLGMFLYSEWLGIEDKLVMKVL